MDEAHGEFISIEGNYAAIVEQLRASGYTVDRTTTAPLTAQTLQGYSVFVIGTPWSSFTVAEIDAVEQFINAGGGLLLTGLGWSWVNPSMGRTLENYPPNVIGRRFGVRFLDDVICDPAGHYGSDSCSPLFLPHVSHSLVEGVAALGGPISPAPISITHDLVYPVLTAGPFGFSNLGHYPPGTYPPVVVVASPGQGRVLAIGHEGYFATNDYDNNGIPNLYDYDNLQFAMNAFRWLAGQSTTQTPTTTPTSTPVATTTPGPWTYWLRLPLVVVEW